MKNILKFLALSILFISCSSDDNSGGGQNPEPQSIRLKKITYSDGSTTNFIYNNNILSEVIGVSQNQNLKREFIYENNKLVRLKKYVNNVYQSNEDLFFQYTNSNITTSSGYESNILFSHQYQYNTLSQMTEDAQYDDSSYCCTNFYTYNSNGNISLISNSENSFTTTFSYDDKKNPLYYTYPEAYSKIKEISKNNIISESSITYNYEYNSDNFPLKKKLGTTDVEIYEYE